MFDDPQDIVATVYGYACRYTPTIMSGAVLRFNLPHDRRPLPFEVSASRDGVMVSGASPLMHERSHVLRLAGVLALAHLVHEHLRAHDRDVDGAKALVRRPPQLIEDEAGPGR